MKHLRTFENFENIPVAKFELEENQVDDLHEQFEMFIEDWEAQNKEQLSPEEMQDMFAEDENGELSEEFVKFLQYLEDNTDWFDFKMMHKVRNDLAIIVAKMGIDYEDDDEDDDEDFDFADEDPEWPYEKEEETGEFADADEDDEDEIEQLRQKTYSKEPEMNLDEILDKINDSGYDSLTDEEKEFLKKQESKITKFKNFKNL